MRWKRKKETTIKTLKVLQNLHKLQAFITHSTHRLIFYFLSSENASWP